MRLVAKNLPLLLLLVAVTAFVAGCGGHHYHHYITIINHSPWDVCVEPFDIILLPGDVVDVEVDHDVIHVEAFRCADGLLLEEETMSHDDVMVIEWP